MGNCCPGASDGPVRTETFSSQSSTTALTANKLQKYADDAPKLGSNPLKAHKTADNPDISVASYDASTAPNDLESLFTKWSEVVDGSQVISNLDAQQVIDALNTAQNKSQLDPIFSSAKQAVGLLESASQSSAVTGLFATLKNIDWVKSIVVFGDTISQAHPWVNAAWFVVGGAIKIIQNKKNADRALMLELVKAMKESIPHISDIQGIDKEYQTPHIKAIMNDLCKDISESAVFAASINADGVVRFAAAAVSESLTGEEQKYKDSFVGKLQSHRKQLDTALGTGGIKATAIVGGKVDRSNAMLVDIKTILVERLPVGGAIDPQDELRNWLAPLPDMDGDIRKLVKARAEGTRQWLLDKVHAWATRQLDDPESQQVYWLLAQAGAGKSVVAASVENHFKSQGLLGAKFFCRHDKQERRDPARLVASIAFQLSRSTGFEQYAAKLLELKKEKNDLFKSSDAGYLFEELLEKPLKQVEASLPSQPVVIIIDALDEIGQSLDGHASDQEQEEAIRQSGDRAELLETLAKWKKLPKWLRLFMTSRPDKDILRALRGPLTPSELELTNVKNLEDIQEYADSKVTKWFYKSKPEKDRRDLAKLLATRSEGLFIWLRLTCDDIGKATSKWERLLEYTNDQSPRTPKELYSKAYDRALKNAVNDVDEEDRDLVTRCMKTLLETIVCVQTPVSGNVLAGLCNIEPNMVHKVLSSLLSVLSVNLRESLGYDNDDDLEIDMVEPVQVIHKSFTDMLTDKKLYGDGQFHVDLTTSDTTLANKCLEILTSRLQSQLENLNPVLGSSDEIQYGKGPIVSDIDYSARFWIIHVDDSDISQVSVASSNVLEVVDAVSGHVSRWGSATTNSAGNGCINTLKWLVQQGANVNTPDDRGQTPLFVAAEGGHIELVRYLVEKCQADVNKPDNRGQTPVFAPTRSDNIELVQYLVEKCQADVNKPDNRGQTPVLIATYSGNIELVQYLVEKCQADVNKPDNDGTTPVLVATRSGNIELVQYLVEKGQVNINTPDNDGQTPLFAAAYSGNIELVQYLVEKCQADVNKPNKYGKTPVFEAAYRGNIELVQYLVEKVCSF
ncbi:hypothetical protein SmJEL517_g05946 [Synchytrium microbalum]|uniref:Nephrocystin 3-like N-terminal domain-containing protein n=1 Tax=Synchytrium microbalum TaxID=1806994 RepID=A0A507BZ02_9FUNG|nr:uncharacterized protein SmJEL517_g05946 [Synchytrium microbalum]TPX30503.1 hypothetical protein SmJEL517_g05946 [Synchytrium microbalum]